MANFEVVFLDGEGNETYIRCLKKFHVAKAHADSVAGQVWVNYIDKSGKMDRQKIYPKEQPTISWTEINDALCIAARIKKITQPFIFEYVVYGYDASLAGPEAWIEYNGFDRIKALKAKQKCEDTACGGSIEIIVRGRENEHYARKEAEEYYDDEEMLVAVYPDGTAVLEDCTDSKDYFTFQVLMGHGNEAKRYYVSEFQGTYQSMGYLVMEYELNN